MNAGSRSIVPRDLAHDLVLPTLLFAALGAMTWAVRGCAGAGGMNAHVAPGLTWGAAWWFLARERGDTQMRRYASGWILLALAAGFAIAGERGWMQWPHFFDGHLATNYGRQEYVPISQAYGFLWFFIAGTAWAGLPACLLAWCGSGRPLRAWEWTLRIGCGFAGAYLAWRLFAACPRVFLPLYDSIQAKYLDFVANPNLKKLYRDNGSSLRHIGFCIGFLVFEISRKDWRNVKLILTVGLLTGAGWAACQNWHWAARVWPDATFNFGRCWEVSAGICIGIGFGLAYYLVNRRVSPAEHANQTQGVTVGSQKSPWLVAAGLLVIVGVTLFWPQARDLRQPVGVPGEGPHYIRGAIWLLTGIACAGIALGRSLPGRERSNRDRECRGRIMADFRPWGELALVLVLSWFIKTQMASEYGDGVADGALAGVFGPGTIYFAIALLYVAVRILVLGRKSAQQSALASPADAQAGAGFDRDFDWLASYLGLTVVASWCLSVGLMNPWHAPVFLGIVVAAFGIAYHRLAQRFTDAGSAFRHPWRSRAEEPMLERWGVFLGLVYGLGISLRKALKGGANLYVGNEDSWDAFFWNWVSLGMLACLVVGAVWILRRGKTRPVAGDAFFKTSAIIWLVLIAQNVLAQVVTGPLVGPRASWNEFAFSLLYVVLFALTAVIVIHYQRVRGTGTISLTTPNGLPALPP